MQELKIIKLQNNSDMCIVCGVKNTLSLNARFYALEEDIILAEITGRDEHQSYPGRMHGGMISAILDETIGRAVQISNPEIWGVTSKLEVVFKKPVPLNEPIRCFAKIKKLYSVAFVGNGYIEDQSGNVLATATGTYVRTPVEKIAEGEFFWEQVPTDDPPKTAILTHPELL